jgi:mRNA interferase RelE/StbE
MWRLFFKREAKKDLQKLDLVTQKRIKQKFDFFLSHEDPLFFATKLVNSRIGEYRFRIWDYRVICDVDNDEKIIIIAIIGHRKEIYKNI